MERATITLEYGDLDWLSDRMMDTRAASLSEGAQAYAGRVLAAIRAAKESRDNGRVGIEVLGGVVQDVTFMGAVPAGLVVAIKDYDIDGAEEPETIELGYALLEHTAP